MKSDAAIGVGGKFRCGIPLPLRGVKRDEVPGENVDAQVWTALDQRAQERAKLLRQAVVCVPGRSDQPGPAMDIPSDDVDEILRLEQRLPQGRKIGRSIVQNRDAPRLAPPPDGVAGDQGG